MKKLFYLLIFLFLHSIIIASNNNPIEYSIRVKDSETLYEIIKTHLYNTEQWRELLKYNNLKIPKDIIPGSIVKIPVSLSKTRFINIVNLYGKVNYLVNNNYHSIESGNQAVIIRETPKISLGSDSKCELVFDSGTRFTLLDNTDLAVNNYTKDITTWKTRVNLKKGAVYIRIPQSKEENIILDTIKSRVVVKAGLCYTKIYPNGQQKIAVYRGKALIKLGNKKIDLLEGYGMVISKDSLPQKTFKLPKEINIK
ncbi:MAG: FecR domain-containing protein [Spirochaetota bacterium]|nr:FecR domain-containing protein [Spirochaetota bacterium]